MILLTYCRKTGSLWPSKSQSAWVDGGGRRDTILEASEAVGVNIDYSCRVGTCGLCKVKLLAGTVSMEIQDSLDASEKQNQVILACQAKSTGDVTVDA